MKNYERNYKANLLTTHNSNYYFNFSTLQYDSPLLTTRNDFNKKHHSLSSISNYNHKPNNTQVVYKNNKTAYLPYKTFLSHPAKITAIVNKNYDNEYFHICKSGSVQDLRHFHSCLKENKNSSFPYNFSNRISKQIQRLSEQINTDRTFSPKFSTRYFKRDKKLDLTYKKLI